MEPETEHPAEAENTPSAEAPAAPAEAPKSPTNGGVMDVVAPPPADKVEPPSGAEAANDEQPAAEAAAPAKVPKPVTPKKPRGNGVTAAIVATVVIVLGLAILATYAFIHSR